MSKRIVGYVISHTGKPGGPWEAMGGRFGTATSDPSERISVQHKQDLQFMLGNIQRIHPDARILRLVRRTKCAHIPDDVTNAHCNKCGAWLGNGTTALCTMAPEGWSCSRALNHDGPCAAVLRDRHRAEEDAVVEAAMAFYEATTLDLDARRNLMNKCAALRAKRGG